MTITNEKKFDALIIRTKNGVKFGPSSKQSIKGLNLNGSCKKNYPKDHLENGTQKKKEISSRLITKRFYLILYLGTIFSNKLP